MTVLLALIVAQNAFEGGPTRKPIADVLGLGEELFTRQHDALAVPSLIAELDPARANVPVSDPPARVSLIPRARDGILAELPHLSEHDGLAGRRAWVGRFL